MSSSDTEHPSGCMAKPQAEHQWLQRLVGEWAYEVHASMGPDKPTENFKGSEKVRSLGGLWIVADGEGEMPGGGMAQTMMTLGFDPQRGHFVGTWVGSMMTHLWVYQDAFLDADRRRLTLPAEGPAMTGDKMAKYQDVIEFVSDDHRVLTSHIQADDGSWQQFMKADYRRKK